MPPGNGSSLCTAQESTPLISARLHREPRRANFTPDWALRCLMGATSTSSLKRKCASWQSNLRESAALKLSDSEARFSVDSNWPLHRFVSEGLRVFLHTPGFIPRRFHSLSAELAFVKIGCSSST